MVEQTYMHIMVFSLYGVNCLGKAVKIRHRNKGCNQLIGLNLHSNKNINCISLRKSFPIYEALFSVNCESHKNFSEG